MFVVDTATADAFCRAFNKDGKLAAIVELRRHFPLHSKRDRTCRGRYRANRSESAGECRSAPSPQDNGAFPRLTTRA